MTDGTTHTLLFGEVIITTDVGKDDFRGRIWNDYGGFSLFSTLQPPNTSVSDKSYGINSTKSPCTQTWGPTTSSAQYLRSYYNGGVNAVFMDASVRFLTDGIDPSTYLLLGSRNDGQVINNY